MAVTSSTEVPSGVVSDSNYAKLFVPWTSDPVGTNPNSNSKMTFSDNSISPAQWPMANVAIGASYHGLSYPILEKNRQTNCRVSNKFYGV